MVNSVSSFVDGFLNKKDIPADQGIDDLDDNALVRELYKKSFGLDEFNEQAERQLDLLLGALDKADGKEDAKPSRAALKELRTGQDDIKIFIREIPADGSGMVFNNFDIGNITGDSLIGELDFGPGVEELLNEDAEANKGLKALIADFQLAAESMDE